MQHILIVTTLLLLLLSGCGVNDSNSGLVEEAKKGKEKWQEAGLNNYEYTYQTLCFCAFTDPVIVVVENDSVKQVLNAETGEPFTIQYQGEEEPIFEIYPQIFHTVDNFYDRWIVEIPVVDKAEFEWDKKTGMPLSMYFDRDKNASDDEITYRFLGFSAN